MHRGEYIIYRNKMYDGNSMKSGREKWKYTVEGSYTIWEGRVDSEKVTMYDVYYAINPKTITKIMP